MGSPQAAPEGENPVLPGPVEHTGGHLLGKVIHPLLMPPRPPIGLPGLVRPGLPVDGVHRKDDNLAGFDPGGHGFGHVEVAKVEEAAVLTGDIQHRPAGVAVDHALHIPPQGGAVIGEILRFHRKTSVLQGRTWSAPRIVRGRRAHSVRPCRQTSNSYIRVSMKKGICFSQLASQWSPPGTMRQVSRTPRVSSWPAIRANCPCISS